MENRIDTGADQGSHLDQEYSTHPDIGPILVTQGSKDTEYRTTKPPRKSSITITGPSWLRCVYNRLNDDGLGLLVFTGGLIVVAAIFLILARDRRLEANLRNYDVPDPEAVHRSWLFWSVLLASIMLLAFWGARTTIVNQMVAGLQVIVIVWLLVSEMGVIPSESFSLFLSVITVIFAMVILLWVGSTECYRLPTGRSVIAIAIALMVLSTLM